MNNEVPTTTISVRLKTGQMHEPMDKLGLAALTAAMVDEGTESMSVEDISHERS
ncbi:hypothetical protein N9M10_05300 [Hellea sp.]|nr:hypothetical protein [Hellea sp.]